MPGPWPHCAQNADHLAHNHPFSAFFAEVVCTLGTIPPRIGASPSPNGGIALHEGPTRRRHAPRGLHVVQNPHSHRCGGRAPPTKPGRVGWREKTPPTLPLHQHFREKTRPASPKSPKLGCFQRAGRTFSRSRTHQAAQGEQIPAQGAATWRRCNHRHHCGHYCRPV